jgi:hypothetical protein
MGGKIDWSRSNEFPSVCRVFMCRPDGCKKNSVGGYLAIIIEKLCARLRIAFAIHLDFATFRKFRYASPFPFAFFHGMELPALYQYLLRFQPRDAGTSAGVTTLRQE